MTGDDNQPAKQSKLRIGGKFRRDGLSAGVGREEGTGEHGGVGAEKAVNRQYDRMEQIGERGG